MGRLIVRVYGGDVNPEPSLPRLPPFSHPQSYDSRHKHHQHYEKPPLILRTIGITIHRWNPQT
jgi:hypothetical protein